MSGLGRNRPKDAQAERTRWELWAILAIVAVVIFGSIAWRAISHHPAQRQTDWTPAGSTNAVSTLPAAAGAPPRTAP